MADGYCNAFLRRMVVVCVLSDASNARVTRWRPGWRMTLLVLAVLPILIRLGTWQLDRAEEKRAYENAYLERQGMLPVAPPRQDMAAAFSRVKLEGRFDSEQQFLLDNQVRDGRVGYWVINAFHASDGRTWLVNRGWIAAGTDRSKLPDIRPGDGPVEVVVVVWPDTGLLPLLKEDPWDDAWPKRVQRPNVARMAALVGAAAVELRLEAGQPGVLSAAPLLMVVPSVKHTGYAVQWFALAGVLCISFIIYGFVMAARQARPEGPEHV